jgi:hypothetical protein
MKKQKADPVVDTSNCTSCREPIVVEPTQGGTTRFHRDTGDFLCPDQPKVAPYDPTNGHAAT